MAQNLLRVRAFAQEQDPSLLFNCGDRLFVEVDDTTGERLENRSNTFTGIVAIPEPATVALVGLGLAGLAATRRRKQ